MVEVHAGRFTAAPEREIVVFRIGMRINRLRRVRRWWPVFTAMPRMLRELERHPELGLLHAEAALSGRTIVLTQWWESFAQLERFARDRDLPHLPAWRAFNRRVGASGDVGIFHETYLVAPGSVESFYGNMPVAGLAAATRHVPVGAGAHAARERLYPGARTGPAVEPY